MTITFRIRDDLGPTFLPSADLNLDAFRSVIQIAERHGKRQRRSFVTWHYGHPNYADADDPICATVIVSNIPLATLAAPTGQDARFVSILDEAQWHGRQLELTRSQASPVVRASVSDDQDKVAPIEVSNQHGYAILHALGLKETSVGSISLLQLRSVLQQHRFTLSGLLRYLPTFSAFTEYQGDPNRTRMEWS